MSVLIFPTLKGEEWNIKRSQIWQGTTVQENISGKRRSINNWSSPRWQWEISFAYLDSTPSVADLQNLQGFFNQLGGRFDTFQYADKDDYTITGAGIGSGNGINLNFQLDRAWGGFVEPVFAPNVVSNVYVNGSAQGSSIYAVNNWGSSAPGIVAFSPGNAPGSSQPVTADFTYYWPCRFDVDSLTYNNFMTLMHENKSVKFSSEK